MKQTIRTKRIILNHVAELQAQKVAIDLALNRQLTKLFRETITLGDLSNNLHAANDVCRQVFGCNLIDIRIDTPEKEFIK